MRACLQSFLNRWERSAHGHSHLQLQHTTQDVKYKGLKAKDISTAASAWLIVDSLVICSAFCLLSIYFFIFKERNLGAKVRHYNTAHSQIVNMSHVEVLFSNLA